MPLEYAKYKNRPTEFEGPALSLCRQPELRALSRAWNKTMTDDPLLPEAAAPAGDRKPLTPAAQRALAEAEARRKQAEARMKDAKPAAKEFQGPKGPEPTRYGDWETKGIASDF